MQIQMKLVKIQAYQTLKKLSTLYFKIRLDVVKWMKKKVEE